MKGPEGTHAWTVTVGAKGQIVIPKEARTLFSIQPGDTLLLLADEKRGLAIPEKGSFASLFQQVFRENPQVEPRVSWSFSTSQPMGTPTPPWVWCGSWLPGGIRSGTIPSRPFKRSFKKPARPLSPVTMPRWG